MSDFGVVVSAPTGRFDGIERPYSADDVLRLRGSFPIAYTLARRGAMKLWELLQQDVPYVRALGADTGNQAMQMVRAGLRPSTFPAGRSRPTPTLLAPCTPTRSLYPANTAPSSHADQPHPPARRPDRAREGDVNARLVRADRRRCRGWFRRPAQLLRDHESLYRGGRRRRSLRRPARVGKEVRPSWRQSSDPDPGGMSATSMLRGSPPTSRRPDHLVSPARMRKAPSSSPPTSMSATARS